LVHISYAECGSAEHLVSACPARITCAMVAEGSPKEHEDTLTRCLANLRSSCFETSGQVEVLRSENRALKARLAKLEREGCKEEDVLRQVNLPGCAVEPREEDHPKTGSKLEMKPEISRKSTKTKSLMGITEDSTHISLGAARLGMVQQRDELMEELELDQAKMRRMMSAIVPSTSGKRAHNLLQKLSRHILFKFGVMLVILANSIYLGFDADVQVKNSFQRLTDEGQETPHGVLDILFPALFVLELCIRMGAEKLHFFQGEERWWNVFDIVLVANSLAELAGPLANFSFLRILRVFRMVRIIRIVRNVKGLKSLRTMVFALINSFTSLLWAFFMIILIIFVFGVLFCHGVAAHNLSLDPDDTIGVKEALDSQWAFGSLWETSISLFSAVSGGNDWLVYGSQLRRLKPTDDSLVGEFYFITFCFYVAFCTIGMLNVVTGIFVDSAVTTRTEDEVVDAFKEQMNLRRQEVRRIFTEADVDGVGSLTFEQLKEQFDHPWVKAYFSGLDIDPNEAAIIFTLMDADHNGRVTIEEFIEGTMKLKGSAKSVDMLLLMFDQVRFQLKFNNLCSFLEDEIKTIKTVLLPGALGVHPWLPESSAGQQPVKKLFEHQDVPHHDMGHLSNASQAIPSGGEPSELKPENEAKFP